MRYHDIEIPENKIADFCVKNHIHRLSLYGSVLGEDFRTSSDIDVLVEFEPGHVPGLIRFSGMELELSEVLGGRKTDLRTPQDLSKYFRDEVISMAETIYEQ